jgi:predicted transcriptional regulator
MTSKILLSIHPEQVENILNGTKLFEIRKSRCRKTVDSIVIYATAPEMRIVAEVKIEDVIVGDVLKVWSLTKGYAGISYQYYQDYYKGKKFAVAYKLGTVIKYEKIILLSDLGIVHPPHLSLY